MTTLEEVTKKKAESGRGHGVGLVGEGARLVTDRA